MPGREESLEADDAAPAQPVQPPRSTPTSAPPSFGLSGSISPAGSEAAQRASDIPSSPWWAVPDTEAEQREATTEAAQQDAVADDEAAEVPRVSPTMPESSGSSEATLTPDAILPPGPTAVGPVPMRPLRPPGPPPPGTAGTTPMAASGAGVAADRPTSASAPGHHTYGRLPPVDGPPPSRVSRPGFGGGRRLAMVAAGGLAAIAVSVVGVMGLSAFSERTATPNDASKAPPGQAAAPQPSPPPSAPRTSQASSIDSEKTDRQPLRLSDVFPARPLFLGGQTYRQDKTSVNHQCSLVARAAMARALVRGNCRSVVRATYVDTEKRLAVTAGVVAMPTRALAVRAHRSGDPSEYEWFRGMVGKVAKDIDRAGGYAASTTRGRFIIYSYTTYLDGRPATDDPLLATVGKRFIAHAVRPIERRARLRSVAGFAPAAPRSAITATSIGTSIGTS